MKGGNPPPPLQPLEAHALFVMNLHQSSANLAPYYVTVADALLAGSGDARDQRHPLGGGPDLSRHRWDEAAVWRADAADVPADPGPGRRPDRYLEWRWRGDRH